MNGLSSQNLQPKNEDQQWKLSIVDENFNLIRLIS